MTLSKRTVLTSFIWKSLERFGVQLSQLVIQLIIARILFPEDYGIIAIVNSVISILNVFITNGLTQSLIQKNTVSHEEFTTVFYFNILISIILYLCLFSVSPMISQFYEMKILNSVIRIQGLTLIFGAASSVQTAYLNRNFQFKKTFYRSMIWILVQGLVGIYLAINGYGVWALVYSNLIATIIGSIVLWFSTEWRPSGTVSFQLLINHLPLSASIMFTNLADVFMKNLYSLIIGKMFSKQELGNYSKGQNVPSIISNLITVPLASVLYPVFSRKQNNITSIKKILRSTVSICSFIILPIMIGLSLISSELIIVLLSEKWIGSVRIMQISSLTFALWPFQTLYLQVIKGLGRSKDILIAETMKVFLVMLFLFLFVNQGLDAILIGYLFSNLIFSLVLSFIVKLRLTYCYHEQFFDVAKPVFSTFIMYSSIQLITFASSPLFAIIQKTTIGILVFAFTSLIIKDKNIKTLIGSTKSILNRGNQL
jgi:teichuronic acid exporter